MRVTLNLNTQEGVTFTLYPDNQPHVNVYPLMEGDEVTVICSITSSLKLMHLVQCSNALDKMFVNKKKLIIPYLMGARFDRVMNPGDSFDLQVIAKMINDCGFAKVELFDVHSDVATALINNSVNNSNEFLVTEYEIPNSILICPDAGASKKVKNYFDWNDNIIDVVYCNKERNLRTGDLTIKVLEPERCTDRNCVIIDDLCDGGGTFLGIASQILPTCLTLIVTHGIFSKGFKALEEHFDQIIVADTYKAAYESSIVKLVNI